MKKRFTKIICVTAGIIAAVGITASAAGCSNYYSGKKLDGDYKGTALNNGGFTVKKGDYIYFINGVESNTADNKFGNVVKGGIYRISTNDFANHNYSKVDCVVPVVTYTADYDAGMFIYGDYVYYATPSVEKNSEGVVQNDTLDLKSTKLDGTETLKTAYVQFPSTSYQYRFVEEGDTVYLMYVAEGEKLYEEDSGVTNLHSYNTQTGEDTLLAYNVGSVVFDKTDKTNTQVYYTMSVKDYTKGSNYGYNQVYTVKADATVDQFADKLNSETVPGWNDKDEDGKKPDRYINCGELVFDGIGVTDVPVGEKATVFNYKSDGSEVNLASYTYELSSYQSGNLFYTRTSNTNEGKYLFSVADEAIKTAGANWNAVANNAKTADTDDKDERILVDGSDADKYTYLFNGDKLEKVLIAEGGGGIYVNMVDENGKLHDSEAKGTEAYYPVVKSGTCTILFVDGNYLYYSVSGSNGYSFWRVDYTGAKDKYGVMPADKEVGEYTPVKILDLDATSSWFAPELVDNQLMFATEIDSDYLNANYVMACDLRAYDAEKKTYGKLMENSEIDELNKKFEGISEIIDDFNDADKYDTETYKNLTAALRYAFVTGEKADVYLEKLAKACNEKAVKDAEEAEEEDKKEIEPDSVYSEEVLAEYANFLKPAEGNVWEDYTATKQVNGQTVYANRRDYYYAYLGEMSEADADEYVDALRSKLEPMPEVEGWWNNQTTAVKVCVTLFPILGGLLLIGGGVVLALWLVRRKKEKMPTYTKKKIKVDTTDDKNIDVYSDDDSSANEENKE